jgi:F-type H+-transporting ATPase subunit b
MPQLDFTTYMPQIFWVILVFLCFWLVMDRFLLPKITERIEERKSKYNDLISKAEAINNKALASLQKYEKKLAAAKEKASVQISKNEQELQEFIAKKEKDLEEVLNKKIIESKEILQREKEETLAKIDELAVSAAYTIIQHLDVERKKEDIEKSLIEEK